MKDIQLKVDNVSDGRGEICAKDYNTIYEELKNLIEVNDNLNEEDKTQVLSSVLNINNNELYMFKIDDNNVINVISFSGKSSKEIVMVNTVQFCKLSKPLYQDSKYTINLYGEILPLKFILEDQIVVDECPFVTTEKLIYVFYRDLYDVYLLPIMQTEMKKIPINITSIDELTEDLARLTNVITVSDGNRSGTFKYDANKKLINDNGITINGWVRQYSGYIMLDWFNPYKDGETDDKASFESATKASTNKQLIFVSEGEYYVTSDIDVDYYTAPDVGGLFISNGNVRFTKQEADGIVPRFLMNLTSDVGESKIQRNLEYHNGSPRDELHIYNNSGTYMSGNLGSGINLYGLYDPIHCSNIAFSTGKKDQITPRMIIGGVTESGKCENRRNNIDTRLTIGNDILKYVDCQRDTGMLNLYNPDDIPALFFESCDMNIGWEHGKDFTLGTWTSGCGNEDGSDIDRTWKKSFTITKDSSFLMYDIRDTVNIDGEDKNVDKTKYSAIYATHYDTNSKLEIRSNKTIADGSGIDMFGDGDIIFYKRDNKMVEMSSTDNALYTYGLNGNKSSALNNYGLYLYVDSDNYSSICSNSNLVEIRSNKTIADGSGIDMYKNSTANKSIVFYTNGSTSFQISGSGSKDVLPGANGVQSLGGMGLSWDNIYSVNGVIETSDERLKTEISDIPDEVLDAWEEIPVKRFKFKKSVENKGTEARWHVGRIAQDIEKAFKKHGLDAFEYGVLCYAEWETAETVHEAKYEIVNGEKILVEKEWIEKVDGGNRYSVRYGEASQLDMALLSRNMSRLLKIK